jgi:hypothetical protein
MRKVVLRGPKKLNKTGRRVGTKRSDRRWQDAKGELWDSRFESIVYERYKELGYNIRRCSKSDTVYYTVPVRSGSCTACGSTEVGQRRTYTPDFFIDSKGSKRKTQSHYLETKGYLRPKERSLLRALCATNPGFNLRILFQRDYRASKTSSIVEWAKKFLKTWHVSVWREGYELEES